MYYLQSRYYNPETGRFINADKAEYSTFETTPTINNLFTYVCNDPVNNTDYDGNLIRTIIEKILIGISKGLLAQFFVDTIEWAFKYYFINKNAQFKISNPEDYLASVLSAIVDEFKPSNSLALAASIVVIIVKYIPKVILGRFRQNDAYNLIMDILKTVLVFLLRNSLKKLCGKVESIKKARRTAKSDSIKKRLSKSVSKLNLKIKYKGVVINMVIPNIHQIVSSTINILCPAS